MRAAMVSFAVTCLLASSAGAQSYSYQNTFSDGASDYLYENTTNSTSGDSLETLSKRPAGTADDYSFVATLFGEGATGNWTGSLADGRAYADQWDDNYISPCHANDVGVTPGDYRVVVGADSWRCWEDFDAYLSSLNFWGGGIYIGYPIYDGGAIIYYSLMSAEGGGGSATAATASNQAQGLLKAMGKASPQARFGLMDVFKHIQAQAAATANKVALKKGLKAKKSKKP